jgi:hypothetical protein
LGDRRGDLTRGYARIMGTMAGAAPKLLNANVERMISEPWVWRCRLTPSAPG